MSWDLIVQDLPAGVDNVDDVPGDYVPKVIGKRSEIIAKIMEIAPMADFSDPSWGVIDGDGFSMEVSMGDEEECEGFGLHIRGGDAAIGLVGYHRASWAARVRSAERYGCISTRAGGRGESAAVASVSGSVCRVN